MLGSSYRLALALLGMSLASVASAHDRGRPFITYGVEVDAPRGFAEMCRSDHTFCSDVDTNVAVLGSPSNTLVSPSTLVETASDRAATGFTTDARHPDGRPKLRSIIFEQRLSTTGTGEAGQQGVDVTTDEAAALLQRVNRYVNERVVQRTDEQVYGRPEVWHRSGIGRNAAGDCEDIAIEKRIELIEAGFPADRLTFAVVYARQVGLHAVLMARIPTGDYVLDSRTPYVNRWDRTAYSFVTVQSNHEPMHWFAPGATPVQSAAVSLPVVG